MQSPITPVTLESVYAELQELKALLSQSHPIPIANNQGDLLTPQEVCNVLKISRSQFERMKRNGFIKVYRSQINPKSRKIYVSWVEISKTFSKDFIDTTALQ